MTPEDHRPMLKYRAAAILDESDAPQCAMDQRQQAASARVLTALARSFPPDLMITSLVSGFDGGIDVQIHDLAPAVVSKRDGAELARALFGPDHTLVTHIASCGDRHHTWHGQHSGFAVRVAWTEKEPPW